MAREKKWEDDAFGSSGFSQHVISNLFFLPTPCPSQMQKRKDVSIFPTVGLPLCMQGKLGQRNIDFSDRHDG